MGLRAVIQKVLGAEVSVGGRRVAEIGPGLCVFVGIGKEDRQDTADRLAEKIKNLRIFADDSGKMNRSLVDVQKEVLVVSQFTLYGDCTKGNRPSFTDAALPADAERLYECFVQRLRQSGLAVATGQFRAHMNVSLTNDGPVTLILNH
jgi:D-tyrosyl-tRNA(Tyr) deacylase